MTRADAKIVFLNSVYPCLSETFLFNQFETLKQCGVRVDIVSNNVPELDQVHPEMRGTMKNVVYLSRKGLLEILRAHMYAFKQYPLSYLKSLKHLASSTQPLTTHLAQFTGAVLLLRRYRNHPVHYHVNFTYGAAGVALWLKRIANASYTITLHGSDITFDVVSDIQEKLAGAEGIVSISDYNLTFLQRKFPRLSVSSRVRIPLGMKPIRFPERTTSTDGNRRLRLLNVGRLDVHKAQHILIEAMTRLAERGIQAFCDIVGEGPARQALTTQIEQSGVTESVRLLGLRYNREVLDMLPDYDLFVMSSVAEGMPVAIMEAMRARVPIIAPAIGGIPELLGQGEFGMLVPPGDPDALADAIEELSCNPEQRIRLAQAAYDDQIRNYDLATNSLKLVDYFATLRSLDFRNLCKSLGEQD